MYDALDSIMHKPAPVKRTFASVLLRNLEPDETDDQLITCRGVHVVTCNSWWIRTITLHDEVTADVIVWDTQMTIVTMTSLDDGLCDISPHHQLL